MSRHITIDLSTSAQHQLAADLTHELEQAQASLHAVIDDHVEATGADWDTLAEGCQCAVVSAPCQWCESASEEVLQALQAVTHIESGLARARRDAAPTVLPIRFVAEPTIICEARPPQYAFTQMDVAFVTRPCKNAASWRLKGRGSWQHLCDSCHSNDYGDSEAAREPIIRGDGRDESRLRALETNRWWQCITGRERIEAKALTAMLIETGMHAVLPAGDDPIPGAIYTGDL